MPEARKQLGQHRRVKIVEKQNGFLICINGEYVVKLKKSNRRLRTQNQPTGAVLSFLSQEPQLEIDGVPEEPTNLHLGYQQPEVALATAPIYIVYPSGREIEWTWRLDEAEEGGQALIVPVVAGDDDKPQKKRVTPKRPESEKRKTKDSEAGDESERSRKE